MRPNEQMVVLAEKALDAHSTELERALAASALSALVLKLFRPIAPKQAAAVVSNDDLPVR